MYQIKKNFFHEVNGLFATGLVFLTAYSHHMPTVPEVGQALVSIIMDPQQAEAEQIKTFRDFMSNYNKLSEICFEDCVWDFTTRKVLNKESTCALNCAEKYLKMNQRVSARFQVIRCSNLCI